MARAKSAIEFATDMMKRNIKAAGEGPRYFIVFYEPLARWGT